MEQPKTVLFFEKCRLCLGRAGSANIYEVQGLTQDIYDCTCVKVSPQDNLPQKICTHCHEIVKEAKHLRLLATANDTALRSLLLDDYLDNTEKTTAHTTADPTDSVNANEQSQKEKVPSHIDKNSLNSKQIVDRQSHRRKIKPSMKTNDNKIVTQDENTKPTEPVKRFGISVRKDLFEPSPSQVSSSMELNKTGNESETAVPKKRIFNKQGEEIFPCEVCKKTLKTRKKLYMHQRQHNKLFICPLDVCEKKFATKNDLERHKRTHTGEKPYNCNECDKSFAQQGTLKAHKETVHTRSVVVSQ